MTRFTRYVATLTATLLPCFGQAQVTSLANGPAYAEFNRYFIRNEADSLALFAKRLAGASTEQERRLGALAMAAGQFRSDDLRSASRTLDSLDTFLRATDGVLFSYMKRIRSMLFTAVGNAERGLQEADAGLAMSAHDRWGDEYVALMVVRSEALTELGRLEDALEQLRVAQRRAELGRELRGECLVAMALGNIMYEQQRYADAKGCYLKAYSIASEHGFRKAGENALANLAGVTLMMDGPTASLSMYDSLLSALGRRSPELRSRLLDQMAYAHVEAGAPGTARVFAEKAKALADSIGDRRAAAEALADLAYALWDLGEQDRAIEAIRGALRHVEATGDDGRRRDLLWELHSWYAGTGRLDLANECLRAYSELSDSLAKNNFSEHVARSQVRFDTERKEHRIAEQDHALHLAEEGQRRKRLQRNLALGIAALLVVVALLLWRGLLIRRRLAAKEKELHAQQVDDLLHQQELKAMNAMLEGQEKERDRVAKDLHDRLGSMLSAIKMQVGALEGKVDRVHQEQGAQYTKVNNLLDDAVGEVRRISHDLIATTLARFGLAKALEDLCASVRVAGRLEVELRLFGLEQRLERSVEIVIYRIVQEVVSNVLKHAQASELSLSVTRERGRLSLIVADDGRGFDTHVLRSGIGLDNIHARAASIGATVHVDSSPGKGTTVSVECPIVE